MRLPIIPSLVLGLCPLAQAADVQWQFALDASTSHQRFAAGSADLRSLMFTPVAQWDSWGFSVSLPWEASSGGYVVGRNLAARKLCTRLASLSDAQLQRRLARGKLQQAQIDACTAQALGSNGTGSSGTQTGFGDADMSGTYHWALTNDWMLDLGAGYKFDNGDAASGLGSGTQEARLEANLICIWSALTASVNAGVNLITQSAPQANMQDHYGYTSLALDYALLEALTLGL